MQKTSKIEEIVKLWKELEITSVEFIFSCGGDSMNETEILIHTDSDEIKNEEIESYIDEEVYKQVEFYVNSDGHYQGESGVVTIELDDEENELVYSKSSESEWNEDITSEIEIPLTDEEIKLLDNISIIGGDDSDINVIFVGDEFLTDKEEETLSNLEIKIQETARDFIPELDDHRSELNDFYTYSTNSEGTLDGDSKLEITDNKLIVRVNNSYTIFKEDYSSTG